MGRLIKIPDPPPETLVPMEVKEEKEKKKKRLRGKHWETLDIKSHHDHSKCIIGNANTEETRYVNFF